MDKIDFAIIGAIISVIGGLVTLIIQGFFKDSRKQSDDLFNSLSAQLVIERRRIDRLDDKFEKVLHSYGEVFNKLLEKFSSWEDRIKKIMDQYALAGNGSGSSDKKNELDVIMKKEIKSIANDVEVLENEFKELSRDLSLLDSKQDNFGESVNQFRKTLTRLMSDLAGIKGSVERNGTITTDKIETLFKVFKAFNNDFKKLHKRVEEIAELSKSRIKLLE